MSTNWNTICTKFTDDELRIIDQACIKYKTNRSKLIQRLVTLGLKIEEFSEIINAPNSALAKSMSPIVKTMFNKKAIQKLEKETERKLSKIKPKIKQKAIDDVKNLNHKFQTFEKHNPVGAPSQKHGKRGKPSRKDTSLDK